MIPVGTEVEIAKVGGSEPFRRHVMRRSLTFPWLGYSDKLPVTFEHGGYYIRVPRGRLTKIRRENTGTDPALADCPF